MIATIAGAIVLYLLLFFTLAAAVLIPLFFCLGLRYTFRLIRRKFLQGI